MEGLIWVALGLPTSSPHVQPLTFFFSRSGGASYFFHGRFDLGCTLPTSSPHVQTGGSSYFFNLVISELDNRKFNLNRSARTCFARPFHVIQKEENTCSSSANHSSLAPWSF